MAKLITSITIESGALDLITAAAGLEKQSRSAYIEAAARKAADETIRAAAAKIYETEEL